MSKSDLVVKSNRLNTAIQNLSLAEIRIIQLAIVDARETNTGLTTDKPLRIDATRYAEAFDVSRQTAFEVILNAEKTLFERRFSFLDDKDRVIKSRWVQRVLYLNTEAAIEVIFTHDVVNEITRIDGYETFFTKYLLKQTVDMTSVYSVRLYELLVQWKTAKKTPIFNIDDFRQQLGVAVNEYKAMSDFKKRVLDFGVKEINDKSDITVNYKQFKKGKNIVGFSFTVKTKTPVIEPLNAAKNNNRDTATPELFHNMTNSQISTFSAKLAALLELGSHAPMGASTAEYAAIIASELVDEGKQGKYLPYLAKVGYQPAKGNG